MFKYLAGGCSFLVFLPYFTSEPLYLLFSFAFALLGTIFAVLSIKKKEAGFLGKTFFLINALLPLLGILILLSSLYW